MTNYINVEIVEAKTGQIIVLFSDEYAAGFFKFDNMAQYMAQFPTLEDLRNEIVLSSGFEDCGEIEIFAI